MTEFEACSVTHPIIRWDSDYNNILDHALEKPYTYLIRQGATLYEAIDGSTGKIFCTGATAAACEATVLAAMTAGTLILKEQLHYHTAVVPANVKVVESKNGVVREFINVANTQGSPYTISVGAGADAGYYFCQDSAGRYINSWSSTNFTATAQQAIDAGGLITLSDGVFTLSGGLVISDKGNTASIAGCGITRTRINIPAGEAYTAITVSQVNSIYGVFLRDFSIYGTGEAGQNGVVFSYAKNSCSINNLYFENLNTAFNATNSWRSKAINCVAYNCTYGFSVLENSNDFEFLGCIATTIGNTGFTIGGPGTTVTSVKMTNCDAEECGVYGTNIYGAWATNIQGYRSDKNAIGLMLTAAHGGSLEGSYFTGLGTETGVDSYYGSQNGGFSIMGTRFRSLSIGIHWHSNAFQMYEAGNRFDNDVTTMIKDDAAIGSNLYGNSYGYVVHQAGQIVGQNDDWFSFNQAFPGEPRVVITMRQGDAPYTVACKAVNATMFQIYLHNGTALETSDKYMFYIADYVP